MDLLAFLPSEDTLTAWLVNYGSFSLFALMAMGIILLPVPEETMMVAAGALISQGKLHAVPTILAAFFGSMCGITTSYLIGRTIGHHILVKYGGWIGITADKVQRAHDWFEHYGKWTLFFGYFIPGVRHLTGVCAGTTFLEYPVFALFAYCGAFFWVSLFISIGYFLGDYWVAIYEFAISTTDEIILSVVIIVGCIVLYKIIFGKK